MDIEDPPERAAGHISTGGTFDTLYNPILGDTPLKRGFFPDQRAQPARGGAPFRGVAAGFFVSF